MNGSSPRTRLRLHLVHLASAALTVLLTIVFALTDQPAAAALVPAVAVLIVVLARREAQARALARRISADPSLDKLEVPAGAWGELCRAINGLLQERRARQRLATMLPAPLSDGTLRAFAEGRLQEGSEPRVVAVMVVSCGALHDERRTRRTAPTALKALAAAAQGQAQRHDALLQPCGDAIMLVFGAFADQSSEATLRAAHSAAEGIQRAWRADETGVAEPLAISLTCGPAWLVALPGLGVSAVGQPVNQAVQISRLATESPRYRLLCSENAYYMLRRTSGPGWEPAGVQPPVGAGRATTVYGWNG